MKGRWQVIASPEYRDFFEPLMWRRLPVDPMKAADKIVHTQPGGHPRFSGLRESLCYLLMAF